MDSKPVTTESVNGEGRELEQLAAEVDQPSALDRFLAAARYLFQIPKEDGDAAEHAAGGDKDDEAAAE